MKKLSYFFSCCIFGFWTTGVLAQAGNVAAGGDATGSGGSVSFSIGQVNYVSGSDANFNIIQGNQQPFEISVVDVSEKELNNPTAFIYPNPTKDKIILKVENAASKNFSFQLYDENGKLLLYNKAEAEETIVDISEFAVAKYFLKLVDNKTEIKTFKIIKLY